MKRINLIGIALVMLFTVITTGQAQRGNGNNGACQFMAGDLTQEQQDQITSLKTAFMQQTKAERNQLNELRARRQTLETTDPIDKKALMKCIASINEITTNLEKERVMHRQEVKNVLTDEQVVLFDARGKGRKGPRSEMGMGNGLNQGFRGGDCPMANGACGSQMKNGRQGRGMNGQGNKDGFGKGNGQGRGQGMRNDDLNLSESQKEYMNTARVAMLEKEQPLLDQLNELNAKQVTLTRGKSIDTKAVEKVIDEKAKIKLELAKIRTEHRLDVRSQLDDNQKATFDIRRGPRGRR